MRLITDNLHGITQVLYFKDNNSLFWVKTISLYEIGMIWQLKIRLYRNWNANTQSRNADVVDINNLRTKYNNNNYLHGLMWYELFDH